MAVQRTVTGVNDGGQLFDDQSSGALVNNNTSSTIKRKGEDALINKGKSGYSHTGAFADKPISNNFVWQAGAGINYTQSDVSNEAYKVLSLSRSVHNAVDNPYWETPSPSGKKGVGLFQGANLPEGVNSLLDYDFDFDSVYGADGSTGFEGSTGRIDLSDCVYGDQLRVRFDFNIIPQIANTTVEPAL